jgi:hypothetical protein
MKQTTKQRLIQETEILIIKRTNENKSVEFLKQALWKFTTN